MLFSFPSTMLDLRVHSQCTQVSRYMVLPSRARQQCRVATVAPCASTKMHVPSDSFGGKSPERKAADALTNLFTFAAFKIVVAQLEGDGRGSLGAFNAQAYTDLMEFVQANPLKDGDAWLQKLLDKNEMLAVRIMEVRAAYCQEDFEWGMCQKLATKAIQDGNVRLMRQYAKHAFNTSLIVDRVEPPSERQPDDRQPGTT